MIALTNATTDKPVFLAAHHIVAVLEDPQVPLLTCILTVTGVTYIVRESVEQVRAAYAEGRS